MSNMAKRETGAASYSSGSCLAALILLSRYSNGSTPTQRMQRPWLGDNGNNVTPYLSRGWAWRLARLWLLARQCRGGMAYSFNLVCRRRRRSWPVRQLAKLRLASWCGGAVRIFAWRAWLAAASPRARSRGRLRACSTRRRAAGCFGGSRWPARRGDLVRADKHAPACQIWRTAHM